MAEKVKKISLGMALIFFGTSLFAMFAVGGYIMSPNSWTESIQHKIEVTGCIFIGSMLFGVLLTVFSCLFNEQEYY